MNKKDTDAEIRSDQINDVMSLLRLRYRLAERVYYHHTKIKFGAMIGRAVLEANQLLDRNELYRFGDDGLIEPIIVQIKEPLRTSVDLDTQLAGLATMEKENSLSEVEWYAGPKLLVKLSFAGTFSNRQPESSSTR